MVTRYAKMLRTAVFTCLLKANAHDRHKQIPLVDPFEPVKVQL